MCAYFYFRKGKNGSPKREGAGVVFFLYMKYSEKRPHRRGSVALSPLPWLPSLHISGARKPVNIYLPIRVPSSASRSWGPAASITGLLPSQSLA